MSAFESDDHSFSALLLVSPILVQTDRGEVEAKAGEYLVVTAAGRQMVMSGDELEAHMREPTGERVSPVERVLPVEPKRGSILERLRRGKAPDRVVMSVTEEGFQEVSLPDPEPVVEEPAVQETEVPLVEQKKKKKGVFASLRGMRVSGIARIVKKPVEVEENPMPITGPTFTEKIGPELDTELPNEEVSEPESVGVEVVVAEPLPELELELDEEDGMEEVLEDLVVRPEVTPRIPAIGDPPIPVSESPLDLSAIKTGLLESFFGKATPTTGVRMPFAPKGMTKRQNPDICHNLSPVPVPGESREWEPFMPLSDVANRDLARMERAALENIGPPAEPKPGLFGFGRSGKSSVPKKGKKKTMVLPFQKKAVALVEPKKKKYEWVPIDWI